MRCGICEQRDEREVFEEGSRPPVGEQQRQWAWPRTNDSYDVHALIFDLRLVMSERVESPLQRIDVEVMPVIE